jgi:hypothetical protein
VRILDGGEQLEGRLMRVGRGLAEHSDGIVTTRSGQQPFIGPGHVVDGPAMVPAERADTAPGRIGALRRHTLRVA